MTLNEFHKEYTVNDRCIYCTMELFDESGLYETQDVLDHLKLRHGLKFIVGVFREQILFITPRVENKTNFRK